MKRVIALGLCAAALVLAAVAFGAFGIMDRLVGDRAVAQAEQTPHIAFSCGVLHEDNAALVRDAADFAQYDSPYTIYRSSFHFDTLSAEEQLVYHALEYAMESGYTNILVDDALIDSADTLEKVLYCLALDSPLLEQALYYETGAFAIEYAIYPLPTLEYAVPFDGYYISAENFAAEWWGRKYASVIAAKSTLSLLEEGMSEAETAEAIYRHAIGSIELITYPPATDVTVHAYLSDALRMSRTNANGCADGLSLLLNMAGLECAEKAIYDENGEPLHSWNCVKIDGQWYNMDMTGGGAALVLPEDLDYGCMAFSDAQQLYEPLWAQHYPACTTDWAD